MSCDVQEDVRNSRGVMRLFGELPLSVLSGLRV